MIVITGAAGFIGSCLVRKLNDEGYFDLVLVDEFSDRKEKNLIGKKYSKKIHRDDFGQWLVENHKLVQFIFHIGARTDTTEFDVEIFNKLNLNYSKYLWELCVKYGLPFVYASSAATYGGGEFGYADDHLGIKNLKPLNPYGDSKHEFDKWALEQKNKPYFWAGLKFFNVYGPNEYHKGRMASVIFHAFNQIREKGSMNLFRSHRPDFEDGKQLRDFIYVKDLTNVLFYLMKNRKNSGVYNLGSGKARTFLDLALNTFKALGKEPNINFVDTPADIRDKYQYYTQADMNKLKLIAGYDMPFHTLEEGIEDYVGNYLIEGRYL